jgi:proteasome accessory factor B
VSGEKDERLINLLGELLHTRVPLTAEQLRERVPGYHGYDNDESFRRTFERDKDDLRKLGVVVSVVQVEHGDAGQQGYLIRDQDAFLPDPGLEPDELAALQLAVETIRVSGDALGALRSFGGRELPDVEGAIEVDLPATPHLPDLFAAMTEHRVVRFQYNDVERRVHPYRVQSIGGEWYLGGHDEVRDAHRTFRVDRIQGRVAVTDDTFPPPEERPPLRLDPWRLGEGGVTATVKVDADHVLRARTMIGQDASWRLEEDGSAVVELTVSNVDAFRSLVLDFLDHAEVLEPPELRDDIVEWVRQAAAAHGGIA